MRERTEQERREELEANEFARCLLMPRSLVDKWMEEHRGQWTLNAFALAFQVSPGLAGFRLAELGYEIGDGG
jgi:Zn-dependent peptidase ImmA (M78 family)